MIGFFIGCAVGFAAAWIVRELVDQAEAAAAVEELAAQLRHPATFGGEVADRQVWFCRCGSWGFFNPAASKEDGGLMHETGRCYPLGDAL